MRCTPCQAEWLRWLDYQPPQRIGIASGATYDDTPAGVRDRSAGRHADYARLVRTQQNLITTHCAKEHTP